MALRAFVFFLFCLLQGQFAFANLCSDVVTPALHSAFRLAEKNLSPLEEEAVSKIKFERGGTYDRFSELQGMNKEISQFLLEKIGSVDVHANQVVALAVERIAQQAVHDQNAQAAWVTIRASKPNHNFDIPRWHMDGNFFETLFRTFKFAQVLKGSTTLLMDVPDSVREQFIQFEPEVFYCQFILYQLFYYFFIHY